MKNLTFKLIPFIISVLIVVGSVSGICLYSYYKYDNNKLKFIAAYYHYDDYEEVATEEQIENFVKMESAYYRNVNSEITFFDVKSGNKYSSDPSKASNNFQNGATFKDGVLHLPDFFDVKFYLQTRWNTDQEEYSYTYYAYIYNVNYTKYPNLIDHLYLTFVEGTGESPEGELYGTTKLNQVMSEIKETKNGNVNFTNQPSYTYAGNDVTSYAMFVYDNGARGTNSSGDDVAKVSRLVTMSETHSEESELDDDLESRWLTELESATFSIFYSGSQDLTSGVTTGNLDDLQELVRGEITTKYLKATDFNNSTDSEYTVQKGFDGNLFKAGYGKYIFKTIFIQGLITFAVSGVLAVLFYLIWQDDEDTTAKQKIKPQIKKKQ